MTGLRIGAIVVSTLCHAALIAAVIGRTSWQPPAERPEVTISLADPSPATAQAATEPERPAVVRDAPATTLDLPASAAIAAARPLTASGPEPPASASPPPQTSAPAAQPIETSPASDVPNARPAPMAAVTTPRPVPSAEAGQSPAGPVAALQAAPLSLSNTTPGPAAADASAPTGLEADPTPNPAASLSPWPLEPGQKPAPPAEAAAIEPRQDALSQAAPVASARAAASAPPDASAIGAQASIDASPPSGVAEPVEQPAAFETSRDHDEVRRFVDGYDGGPCFFVSTPDATADGARVDGFSASVSEVGRFHAAFIAALGFEPNVIGQHVWSAQCPAVDFLRRTRRDDASAPLVVLDRVDVGSGQRLSGTIRDAGDRTVRLLLISETGLVRDLSPALENRGPDKRFDVPLRLDKPGGPFPEMLLAIAGGQDLATIDATRPVPAARYFESLPTSETATSGKLFLLSR